MIKKHTDRDYVSPEISVVGGSTSDVLCQSPSGEAVNEERDLSGEFVWN